MVTEMQAENWRTGMALLTAHLERDAQQNDLATEVLTAAFHDRGMEAIVGATLGLCGIAELLVNFLGEETGTSREDILRLLARSFESIAGEDGV